MPDAKEIKKRIKSVEDTHKITNAMYLIASTKMHKAKADFDQTKPYFEALRTEIKRMFRVNSNSNSKYFYPLENIANDKISHIVLVVTADKGLAGAYNQNVIKRTLSFLNEHKNTKLYVVGEYGRHYFKEHNINFVADFTFTAQNPTMHRAREISDIMIEEYHQNKFTKMFVIYTDLKSGLIGEANLYRILPFHRAMFNDDNLEQIDNLTYYPSLEVVLKSVIKSYVSGFIYSALVDSFCCEQEARMMAMSQANDNAKKIIENLKLEYNQVRQAAITQEITEISASTRARKREYNER